MTRQNGEKVRLRGPVGVQVMKREWLSPEEETIIVLQ